MNRGLHNRNLCPHSYGCKSKSKVVTESSSGGLRGAAVFSGVCPQSTGRGRGRQSSPVVFVQGRPIRSGPTLKTSSNLTFLLETLSPNTITVVVRTFTSEFWGTQFSA